MSFHLETTLAGYARAAVHLKIRMHEFTQTTTHQTYLRVFAGSRFDHLDRAQAPAAAHLADEQPPGLFLEALDQLSAAPWRAGEPYVLAPAMTAVVAAAADVLDLTGELVPGDAAPSDVGVLFLPEPIYHRRPGGSVSSLGAIAWTRYSGRFTGWAVFGWSPLNDPHDPSAARTRAQLAPAPHLASQLGPYLLSDLAVLPIGRPVEPRLDWPTVRDQTEHHTTDQEAVGGEAACAEAAGAEAAGAEAAGAEAEDEEDTQWEPAPDGRYCIDDSAARSSVCSALAYAFWRIQAQPLATVAAAPLDRATGRRAARAGVAHHTRIVMLRRRTPLTEPTEGEAKWHYRVRFVVRGHWRQLHDRDGNPYRIWIHAHLKGPEDAPLLGGDKVSVLAR
jgi:hypothetical protein